LLIIGSIISLNQITERQRLDGGSLGITRGHQKVSNLGKLGCSLQVDLDSSLGGFFLCLFVVNLTLEDFFLTLGMTNMLDSDMNALFDDTSIDLLVDTDTYGCFRDIEDDSGATVVSLVGHTSVDGWIRENIDVITNLDIHQVLRKMNGSVLTVLLGKHVARTRPDSEGMRHLEIIMCLYYKDKENDL